MNSFPFLLITYISFVSCFTTFSGRLSEERPAIDKSILNECEVNVFLRFSVKPEDIKDYENEYTHYVSLWLLPTFSIFWSPSAEDRIIESALREFTFNNQDIHLIK
ncbi:hypothetical protein [Leptospira dzoumogneensis]|uniref:Uncharacterized protein n=1 Tax=Leptospira dzoumogneensis TaxID=2484904 RepID=A0A4Z1ANR2_9LEPT|nr:hypothetical protein [Leptospira dzoumogneensis]TGM99456.1 hypothetical protein EHR06_09980 [Leptospira dzoumogneensis]